MAQLLTWRTGHRSIVDGNRVIHIGGNYMNKLEVWTYTQEKVLLSNIQIVKWMCRPVTGKSPSTFQLNQIITTFERLSRWSYFRSDLFSPSTRVLGIFCQFLCCWSTTCLEHNWQIHLFNIFEVTFYRTEHCFLKVKNSFHGSGNFSMHSPESPLFLLNRLKIVQLRIMPYIENLTDYKSLRQNGQVFIIIVKHLFFKQSSLQLKFYFRYTFKTSQTILT